MLQEIPLDQLVVPDDNVRDKATDLDGLAKSIASEGILTPINVTPLGDDRFLVVAGTRRTLASRMVAAHPDKFPGRIIVAIPAIVEHRADVDRVVAMLVENLQRSDINAIEEAKGYFRLVDEGCLTQQDIASRIGRSKAHVSKRLSLLALPDSAQKLMVDGRITIEHALQLTKLAEAPALIDELIERFFTGDAYELDKLEDDGSIPQWALESALREMNEQAEIAKVTDRIIAAHPKVGVPDDVRNVPVPEGHELVWFEEFPAKTWDGTLGDDDITMAEVSLSQGVLYVSFYGFVPVGAEGVEDLHTDYWGNIITPRAETPGSSTSNTLNAQRAKQDEERKTKERIDNAVAKRAEEHERTFVAQLATNPTAAFVKPLLQWLVLDRINSQNAGDVAKILGLTVEAVDTVTQVWDNAAKDYVKKTVKRKDPVAVVHKFVKTSDSNTQRALTALVLNDVRRSWSTPTKKFYADIQAANGYVAFDEAAARKEVTAKVKS